ncbi:MAG: PaaI family thioesterase [Novosphingobium sp.]
MSHTFPLTNFACEPDPENPGWHRWRIIDESRFNESVLGKQLVRKESDRTARVRIVPQVPLHTNSANNVHGAVTLSLIDISLFAAAYVLGGVDAGKSVTLDLQTQFIGAGDSTRPLDSVVELLRETRRFSFLRGLVVQDSDIVASFTATIRKPSQR